ncbi:MAG: Hpt domain-containing protein [Syntrophales bacterium]|jgi:HPt (histidine-containing phosphotransfer) domain-containing protein|nr:Hpt domain-containing protein [Syntrophales bacterium]MDD5233859.1 Hpt domain-containing protein [Syntrophales bacterium]MDD5534040.1 Hpt domain-containing protein [Syntrophales bacterium]
MDLRTLAAEIGLELGEFLEVVDIFLDCSGEQLAELSAAFGRNDAGEVYAQSHSIKGAAVNLGLKKIAEIAENMEKCSRKGELSQISGEIGLLKESIADLADIRSSFGS